MTTHNDTYREIVADWRDRVQSFADDLREQGIHVGLGNPGRCVTCGEAWPCEGSKPHDS